MRVLREYFEKSEGQLAQQCCDCGGLVDTVCYPFTITAECVKRAASGCRQACVKVCCPGKRKSATPPKTSTQRMWKIYRKVQDSRKLQEPHTNLDDPNDEDRLPDPDDPKEKIRRKKIIASKVATMSVRCCRSTF